jgi:pimeloyl-ACP methyl ester carboxylesterase
VIVYFHGNTGSLKRWGKIAAEITRFGYDVLAPDYRGYGKSTGKPSEKKLIEDSRLFYEEAKNTYAAEQIVFFGRSLGSGVAVQLAAQVKPQKLILETPFYSLLDVVQSRFKIFPFKWLLRHPFYSNIHIQRVQSPILILHGKKDSIVPFSSAKKLFGLVKDRHNVSFQVFKYGGHNDLSTFPKYTKAIAEFLDG